MSLLRTLSLIKIREFILERNPINVQIVAKLLMFLNPYSHQVIYTLAAKLNLGQGWHPRNSGGSEQPYFTPVVPAGIISNQSQAANVCEAVFL